MAEHVLRSRAMQRPEHVTIRLDEEMNLDIERLRAKLGISRSDLVRLAVRQFIINEESNDSTDRKEQDG